MKHIKNKMVMMSMMAFVLFCNYLPVQAANTENIYPAVAYTDPFEWTEEAASAYPCTDEGDYYLPEYKIDNTANFYIYMENNNSSIQKMQVYAMEALLWRPLESAGQLILNKKATTTYSYAAVESLAVKLNPYNLTKLEALENGTIYYIQYGIPNGYFSANGAHYVNTQAYFHILNPDFSMSEQYEVFNQPTETEEQQHRWLLADNNDLTFCAVYGTKEWQTEHWMEFQKWCVDYQKETGKLGNDEDVNIKTENDATNDSDKEIENTLETSVSTQTETESPKIETETEPTVEIQEVEVTETDNKTEVTSGMKIAAIVVGISILALLIIKIKEKFR